MIIRPATLDDADALVELLNPVILETSITFNSVPKTNDMMRDAVVNTPCFLVAEVEERVIGYVSYSQFRKGGGYERAMEHSIALEPATRGQGVGRALMDAAEDNARQAGVASLWAGVSGENPYGAAFHARLGFEEVARLPKVGFKFGRWMDLILMRKWLLDRESPI